MKYNSNRCVFVEVFPHGEEPCHDTRYFQREFSGRLTEWRRKVIERFVQQQTWYHRCGHEYDCCGCHFESRASFVYQANQVVILIQNLYNY